MQLCTMNFHVLALFICSGGRRSTITDNSALLPCDVIDFAVFIVGCHVTSKQPKRARTVEKKIPAI